MRGLWVLGLMMCSCATVPAKPKPVPTICKELDYINQRLGRMEADLMLKKSTPGCECVCLDPNIDYD